MPGVPGNMIMSDDSGADAGLPSAPSPVYQFGRAYSLIVYGPGGSPNGFDLSQLRFKFSVKRTDNMTPNIADIRVYNVKFDTALTIQQFAATLGLSSQNRGRVVLQAGYDGNLGIIFQGNIKQVILGRESATDTFVDIVAGDGDLAYTFAVVNQTISAGANQADQIKVASDVMGQAGVQVATTGNLAAIALPRGKVFFGNAKDVLRQVGINSGQTWSIQDEQVTFVPLNGYLAGEAVVLTSKTGMIGTPQQTSEGIYIKCLLNPKIRIGTRVQIDNASVAQFKIDLSQGGSASINSKTSVGSIVKSNSIANAPPPVNADGIYYSFIVEHEGDTRGVPWYTNIRALNIPPASNPVNGPTGISYGE